MAVLTAAGISRVAIELLIRALVLPRTATAVPGAEFAGANGDTITCRVRLPRDAKVQASPGDPISYDALDEVPVNLTLTHLYDAIRVSDEDLTLNLQDFAQQVLTPMVRSVAAGAEEELAGVMNGMDATILDVDGTSVVADVLAAREELGDAGVTVGDRWLCVSPGFASLLLAKDQFTRVDATGSPSALRDAVLGQIYGFKVVESAALEAGSAVAYHRSGFVFANRAPVNPRGAAFSQVVSQEGISLRVLQDFSADILSDIVAVSTFAGAAQIFEDDSGVTVKRAVKLTTAAS